MKENKIKKCEEIFEEYMNLWKQIDSRSGDPRKGIEATSIQEMDKLFDLRNRLKDCLKLLPDKYLFDLYGHPRLEKSQNILRERRINNKLKEK